MKILLDLIENKNWGHNININIKQVQAQEVKLFPLAAALESHLIKNRTLFIVLAKYVHKRKVFLKINLQQSCSEKMQLVLIYLPYLFVIVRLQLDYIGSFGGKCAGSY